MRKFLLSSRVTQFGKTTVGILMLSSLAACSDSDESRPPNWEEESPVKYTFSTDTGTDIEPRAFELQGLTEHRVIDTNHLAMQQNITTLSDKVQTIKLLNPELVRNRASIRFHVCEKGITPDLGSCTFLAMAKSIPISQDTLMFGLDFLKGKAGTEYELYLVIPGKSTFYQEVTNKKFIFPQDHYQLLHSSKSKMGDRDLDGIHLNPAAQEIRFNIVQKNGVMPAFKADEEVTSFKASLYTPLGEHIKDLHIFNNLGKDDFPYSLQVEGKSNCCSIQNTPGTYFLHIDYPYTAPPLLYNLSEKGVGLLYSPNGFIIPLEIWGYSTVEIKLVDSNKLDFSETINALDKGFHVRFQPGESLAYRDESGWVFNSSYLAKRFSKELESACLEGDVKERARNNEGLANPKVSLEDYEVSFSGIGRSESISNQTRSQKVDLMTSRLSGKHVVSSEVKCSYSFRTKEKNEDGSEKTNRHSGSVVLMLTSTFSHFSAPAKE